MSQDSGDSAVQPPWTLGMLRELTEGMSDDALVLIVLPCGPGDDWREVGFDISGSLVHPQAVIVSLDEGWEP